MDAPENTIEAFEESYALGYRWMETDVHLSADGVLVSFHDPVDHAALSAHLASAGVHLISLRDGLDGVLVPSKLGGALASARPVVFVGPDQAAASAVIRDHQLGWAGALGDIAGLVAALERLADDADACRSAGKRARAVYETAYRRDDALERFSVVLDEACR